MTINTGTIEFNNDPAESLTAEDFASATPGDVNPDVAGSPRLQQILDDDIELGGINPEDDPAVDRQPQIVNVTNYPWRFIGRLYVKYTIEKKNAQTGKVVERKSKLFWVTATVVGPNTILTVAAPFMRSRLHANMPSSITHATFVPGSCRGDVEGTTMDNDVPYQYPFHAPFGMWEVANTFVPTDADVSFDNYSKGDYACCDFILLQLNTTQRKLRYASDEDRPTTILTTPNLSINDVLKRYPGETRDHGAWLDVEKDFPFERGNHPPAVACGGYSEFFSQPSQMYAEQGYLAGSAVNYRDGTQWTYKNVSRTETIYPPDGRYLRIFTTTFGGAVGTEVGGAGSPILRRLDSGKFEVVGLLSRTEPTGLGPPSANQPNSLDEVSISPVFGMSTFNKYTNAYYAKTGLGS